MQCSVASLSRKGRSFKWISLDARALFFAHVAAVVVNMTRNAGYRVRRLLSRPDELKIKSIVFS